jgi:hypothetical protein
MFCYIRSLSEKISFLLPFSRVLSVELRETNCKSVHFLPTENIKRDKRLYTYFYFRFIVNQLLTKNNLNLFVSKLNAYCILICSNKWYERFLIHGRLYFELCLGKKDTWFSLTCTRSVWAFNLHWLAHVLLYTVTVRKDIICATFFTQKKLRWSEL